MHGQVRDFLRRMRGRWPEMAAAQRVLECGAFDVNGSPREIFPAEEYVGIDWRPGPGVDEVGFVHEYQGRPPGYFDLAISTEMLEHDPHWRESLQRMIEMVAPGGSMAVTCAGPLRPAHEMDCAPGGYYEGRTTGDVLGVALRCARWTRVHAEEHTAPNDSYVALVGKDYEWHPVISLIVPAVGNVALTQRCIGSVWQSCRLPSEVILVENGSRLENREALASLGADVFLSYDRMIGYPAAINRGVAAARGEFLCLLNNDVELVQDWWDHLLVESLEQMAATVISPVTNSIVNPPQAALMAQPDKPAFLVDTLHFVCVVLRHADFQRLNGLDEGYGLGNWEDRDFCRKVVQAGGRLVVDPGVFVRHAGHATFGRLPTGVFSALIRRNEIRYSGLSTT